MKLIREASAYVSSGSPRSLDENPHRHIVAVTKVVRETIVHLWSPCRQLEHRSHVRVCRPICPLVGSLPTLN